MAKNAHRFLKIAHRFLQNAHRFSTAEASLRSGGCPPVSREGLVKRLKASRAPAHPLESLFYRHFPWVV